MQYIGIWLAKELPMNRPHFLIRVAPLVLGVIISFQVLPMKRARSQEVAPPPHHDSHCS